MEDLKGKGGGRLKHRTTDGDVPLCLRKTEKESNDDSSSKGKKREENESGSSSTLNKMKHRDMNKMASGSKDLFVNSTGIKDDDTKKRSYFHDTAENLRSMHSSEKNEMVSELEGYRWDAILLSETWRHEQAEIWETHHKHIFMGSGKFDNKTRSRNYVEQKVEAKKHRHRIHQRTCHHYHDRG